MLKRSGIACAGSAGGGKTTLIQYLNTYLSRHWTVTYSRPTKAANIMGHHNANDIPEAQLQLFQYFGLIEQIHAERNYMDRGEKWLSDRTVLDFVGYYMYRIKPESWEPRLFDIARHWVTQVNPYELIVIVPPNSRGYEERDTRLPHGIQEVHENIKYLINHWGLQDIAIEVQTDTPKERSVEIMHWLRVNKSDHARNTERN